jgi:hypothetical protein
VPPDTRQIGVQVNSQLWDEFREYVEQEYGAVRGNLSQELNAAIEAYISGSSEVDDSEVLERLARIEAKIDGDGGSPPSVSRDRVKNKKTEGNVSQTARRRRRIYQDIQAKTGDKGIVSDEELISSISEIAGGSRPTVSNYKERLQQHNEIHEHPLKDSWITDTEEWAVMVHSLRHQGVLSQTEYERHVSSLGTEEFQAAIRVSDEEARDPPEK